MKRSRVILVGVLALGLAGSLTAAANASGAFPTTDAPATAASCPGPVGGKVGEKVGEKLEVKDGKVFLNGKQVASAPATGALVAMKDGKVYVGKDAEALPKPANADVQTGTGEAGPVLSSPAGDEKGQVTCACPGAVGDKMEVKDGKVFLNGKQVASAPATGALVAMKDGKVYVGKDAEALPKPANGDFETGTDGAGPVLSSHAEDDQAHVTCTFETAPNE